MVHGPPRIGLLPRAATFYPCRIWVAHSFRTFALLRFRQIPLGGGAIGFIFPLLSLGGLRQTLAHHYYYFADRTTGPRAEYACADRESWDLGSICTLVGGPGRNKNQDQGKNVFVILVSPPSEYRGSCACSFVLSREENHIRQASRHALTHPASMTIPLPTSSSSNLTRLLREWMDGWMVYHAGPPTRTRYGTSFSATPVPSPEGAEDAVGKTFLAPKPLPGRHVCAYSSSRRIDGGGGVEPPLCGGVVTSVRELQMLVVTSLPLLHFPGSQCSAAIPHELMASDTGRFFSLADHQTL